MSQPTIRVVITVELEPDKPAAAADPADPRASFEKAAETYRPHLIRVASNELGSDLKAKGDASDLVQETYLEAHRDLEAFSGSTEAEMHAWLRTILLNNLREFARRYRESEKRRVDREVPLDRLPNVPEPAAKAPSPSSCAIGHEETKTVREAVGRLSERSRNTVRWRAEEERSYQEIGRQLGCSPVAARKHWLRVVEQLRHEMSARPPRPA